MKYQAELSDEKFVSSGIHIELPVCPHQQWSDM